ncbi:uncharacterized protein LOC132697825 [Cylas formicarius]|uniref:uncharacterized protein LOC132697825 n=1 Tax=Cylas formicarius TaxID=197179 RepID=UPI002958C77B|nr:uncharacterized protein LOC132697825 [Cylas formicarius]
METTHFSIVKQKIIKTNDLLQVFEEQKCKLLNTTKLYKDVKMKYENVLSEKKRLAMENERISYVLNNLKPKHDLCTSELETLQVEHSKLVEKYEKTLIECQLNYKRLEDGLENCTCDKAGKKGRQTVDAKKEKVKELTEKCDLYKQIEIEIRKENAALILKSNQFSSELENLKKRHQDEVKTLAFKNSILQSDVDVLKKKIECLNQKLKESSSLRLELASLEHEKDFEVSRLKRKVRTLSREREPFETFSQETQTSKIVSVEHSVQTDKNPLLNGVNIATQTDENMTTDEIYSVSDIFGEMILPDLLSPVSPFSVCQDDEITPGDKLYDVSNEAGHTSPSPTLPDIIVTPPTPGTEKSVPGIFDLPCRPENKAARNPRMERARANKEITRMHRHMYKRKLMRLQGKRNARIKEKSCSQDDVVNVLKLLRENDINFTVANGSDGRCRRCVCPPIYITNERITCQSKGCISDQHYMVLDNRHGAESELLGFLNVKEEEGIKSLSYGVKSEQQFDLRYLIDGLLDGIRELVAEQRRRTYKKPKRKISDFNSATESELEKLFARPKNVLVRNKMLLRAAKEQRYNAETDSEYMVDSGLVTGTPNMDESSLSSVALEDSLSPFKNSTCPTMLSPLASEKDYACSEREHAVGTIVRSIVNDHQYTNRCEDSGPSRYFLRNKRKSCEVKSPSGCSKRSKGETSVRLSFANLFEQPIYGLDSSYDAQNGARTHVSSEVEALNLQEGDVTAITETVVESYECVLPEEKKSASRVVEVGEETTPALFPLNISTGKEEKGAVADLPTNKLNEHSNSKMKRISIESSSDELPASHLNLPPRDGKRGTNQTSRVVEKIGSNSKKNQPQTNTRTKFISKEFISDSSSDEDVSAARTRQSMRSAIEDRVDDKMMLSEVKEEEKRPEAGSIAPSEKDLFGEDISSSDKDAEDDSSARKRPKLCKKRASVRNKLQRAVVRKARTIRPIYKNPSDCDIAGNENEKGRGKKINVVQNFLIKEDGKSVDLLKTAPKKRPRLDTNCQPAEPDILSKVMEVMNKDFKQQTAMRKSKIPRQDQRAVRNGEEGKFNLEPEGIDDEYADCPKSPDVVEIPEHNPIIIPSQKPVRMVPSRVKYLFNKLLIYSKEEKMLDKIVAEFATQDQNYIADIVIQKLSLDYRDKVENLYPPAPAMTPTQRVLLGFLSRLHHTNHPNMMDTFLHAAEMELFDRRLCKLTIVSPIARVYAAICKLRRDLNRLRRFCCEGFYFMGDFAVPMFFAVLTVWSEVLPAASHSNDFPIVKVLVQLCMLKGCNLPGYNLAPLRDLLRKFYGYPDERWNCDEVFQDVLIEYLRNPSDRLGDCALLLFLKNKPTKWVYRKMKDNIMPLMETIPAENRNLRATFIIMLGNVCNGFDKYEEYDWSVILEMERWFRSLDSDQLDPLSKRSIYLAVSRLPRRPNRRRPAKQKGVEDAAAAAPAN